MAVPAVLVLYTDQIPESAQFVQTLADEAVAQEGRFRVVAVEIAGSPGVVQALSPVLQEAFGQVSALPVVVGLLQGQPVPFFLGVQPIEQVRALLEQFLSAAVANGVTGRVENVGGAPAGDEGEEPQIPALHQEAYDAIDAGDYDTAIAAFEKAIAQSPRDSDAIAGLAQVRLLARLQGRTAEEIRAAAAAAPADVAAQMLVADLDLSGGHVEDAFLRLLDLVGSVFGDERQDVRLRLLDLFEIVGVDDPRVNAARKRLTTLLY